MWRKLDFCPISPGQRQYRVQDCIDEGALAASLTPSKRQKRVPAKLRGIAESDVVQKPVPMDNNSAGRVVRELFPLINRESMKAEPDSDPFYCNLAFLLSSSA